MRSVLIGDTSGKANCKKLTIIKLPFSYMVFSVRKRCSYETIPYSVFQIKCNLLLWPLIVLFMTILFNNYHTYCHMLNRKSNADVTWRMFISDENVPKYHYNVQKKMKIIWESTICEMLKLLQKSVSTTTAILK